MVDNYINSLEEIKKELTQARSDYEKVKCKLDGFDRATSLIDRHSLDIENMPNGTPGLGFNSLLVNKRKEKLKSKSVSKVDLDKVEIESVHEESDEGSQETKKAQTGSHIPFEKHILYEPEPEQRPIFQFPKGSKGQYMLVGCDKVFSNKDHPIELINQSLIKHVFIENDD